MTPCMGQCFLKNTKWQPLKVTGYFGAWNNLKMDKIFSTRPSHIQKFWSKTTTPAPSSGVKKKLPRIWGHHHQLDDQHKANTSYLTIFGAPDTAKIAICEAYLGAKNMVKWGIPDKTLQSAVQTGWPCVNRTPKSKFMTKSHFWPISPLLQCKTRK